MRIENVCFYDENFNKKYGTVEFDEKIKGIEIGVDQADSEYILIPGFVDIHTHGAVGIDWCEDGDFDKLSMYYASHGVTSLCPTTMTLPISVLEHIAQRIEAYKGREAGAYIHGINLEGPFVSKEKCGAQNPEYIAEPDIGSYEIIESISHLSLVDVAPETEGALEFAKQISSNSVISVAHTNADYDQVKKSFENGFSHATHLFNAMTPMNHRSPGAVGAVFENEFCSAELICDGFHINPAVIKIAFNILGKDRPCVISDSLPCAGLTDCDFFLGGQKVLLRNGEARLEDGTIAGSTTNIHSEFLNLISYGIDFETALRCCTINPARAVRVDDVCGSISTGKNADMVLLDKELKICKVFIRGKEYGKREKK